MAVNENQWYDDKVEEIVLVGQGPNGPHGLFLHDKENGTAQEIFDKHLAIAIAERLLQVAEEMPNRPRVRPAPAEDDTPS